MGVLFNLRLFRRSVTDQRVFLHPLLIPERKVPIIVGELKVAQSSTGKTILKTTFMDFICYVRLDDRIIQIPLGRSHSVDPRWLCDGEVRILSEGPCSRAGADFSIDLDFHVDEIPAYPDLDSRRRKKCYNSYVRIVFFYGPFYCRQLFQATLTKNIPQAFTTHGATQVTLKF